MERRLAAILVADIVGYSRLMNEDEEGTHRAVKDTFKLLIEPLVAQYNGRIIKLTGDGALMEFASAVDAVAFSVDMQRAMQERNHQVPEERRIDFRVGINIGDIIIEPNDIYGNGVNVAARLEGLAEPGGICISDRVLDQVEKNVEVGFAFLGSQKVKNIDKPINTYKVLLDREAAGTIVDAPKTKEFGRSWLAACVVMLVIVIIGFAAWTAWPTLIAIGTDQPPSLGSPRLSIAVLPIANLSRDVDQDYFADALTEDLTADLSRISGSFVISRGTAATYRGQELNIKTVARELNVRYLLQGTVRNAREKVHVSVQLTDGQTGQQVWSERYEKTAGDMYAFQNEVTGRVARALNLELKDAVSRQAARKVAGNLDAVDFALRAWAELWTKPQTPVTNAAALAYVARALEIDADQAEAHSVAAYAYARAATYGWGMSRAIGIKKGLAAGDKSMERDPKNADTAYSLAFLYFLAGESRKTQELLLQCVSLNRNHAPAYFFYGLNLLRLGNPQDTNAWVERAFKLSPRDPLRSVWYGTIARANLLTGKNSLALEAAQKGIAANKNHPHNYAVLASAYAHLGQIKKAKAALRDFVKRQPGMTASRYRQNLTAGDLTAVKTYERMISGLRKAGLPE